MKKTECTDKPIEFQGAGRRRVEARFDAGCVSSDGGLLLLREVAERSGLLEAFAACFHDHRDSSRVEHSVLQLVSQRVLGIACGYEDLNDHDTLRSDALLATAAGKDDPTGAKRKRSSDKGHALAGKSTLNRLELAGEGLSKTARYKKIIADHEAIESFFVDTFLDAHTKAPKRIILDLDATDDPVHGNQEGRFFHGYYGGYCYLPLYIFCGDFLLCAKLRPANIDGSAGSVGELKRIVERIRQSWPKVEITIRADSGFAREDIMAWCERNRVDFVLGLKRNQRLTAAIEHEMDKARQRSQSRGKPVRVFKSFRYRTLDSWSRARRVVAKAEHLLPDKANPRFVVTSLSGIRAKHLYEVMYCARGDMENRIKEQQLWLFADRTSTAKMRSNQLRLWFSSIAYVLVNELRRVGLAGTELARAQAGTIRTRLLKIGAIISVSVRRIYVSLSSVYPLQGLFAKVRRNIQRYYYPQRS